MLQFHASTTWMSLLQTLRLRTRFEQKEMPSSGNLCSAFKKKDYFQLGCKSFKLVQWLESVTNMKIYFRWKQENMIEITEQCKSRYAGCTLMGSIDSKKVWERIGKLKLFKSYLQRCQFDGSIMKIWGYFEGTLEIETWYAVILGIADC